MSAHIGRVIRDWPELEKALQQVRRGHKVVFTNGCFDLIHPGHIRYLQEARALGDMLVLGLNTDASVRRLKGPSRPVQAEMARAEILAALGCVDFVTLFPQETPLELITFIKPDVLVKGGDWAVDRIVGGDVVRANGGVVRSLQFAPGFSTSAIIEKILKNGFQE